MTDYNDINCKHVIYRGLELGRLFDGTPPDPYTGELVLKRVSAWLVSALALASDKDSIPDIANFTIAARQRKHGLDYNDGLITNDDHAALFACFVSGDPTLWLNP